MQIPTGERLEGKPGRGWSAAFGARPFRQWGARRPALPLSAGPPGGISSHQGGGPNAMWGDRVRLGVTRGAGGARDPRMLSRSSRRGSRGMSRPLPPGFPLSPHGFACKAPLLLPRSRLSRPGVIHSGDGDGSAGWPASDRRCRRLPERSPSVFRYLRNGYGKGQVGDRTVWWWCENVKSSLFPGSFSQLLSESVGFLLLIPIWTRFRVHRWAIV